MLNTGGVKMKEMYDVLIIGGGVVGSAMARELSRYRLKIGVLVSLHTSRFFSSTCCAKWFRGRDKRPGAHLRRAGGTDPG